MARILLLALEFWPSVGGVQTLTYNFAKRLVERGHQVTVFTCHAGGTRDETIEGIRVRRFRRISSFKYRPWYVAPGMLSQNYSEYDIIHAFGLSFFHTLLASIVARTTRPRFALSAIAHPPSPLFNPWTSKYLSVIGRSILARAAVIIVQCQPEWQGLTRFADQAKFVTIPCGVDKERFSKLPSSEMFRRRYGIKSGESVLLYVGSIEGQKSVSDLVRIMPRVTSTVRDARLMVVGSGSRSALTRTKKFASELGVSERIQLTGPLSEEDILQAYACADVFVFPSRTESFGIVLVEAAAAGLPIVSTKVGVAEELVRDGETGYTCERCDDSFADKIVEVLTKRSFRDMAVRNRNYVLKRFEWNTIVDSLEQTYAMIA